MGRFTLIDVFRDQFTPLPDIDKLKVDLSGKTVIVLGSNTGLGLEAARHFAAMNPAKLILACRNVSKAERALSSIRESTQYSGGEVWKVDLTDFSSVSAFADRFAKEGGGRLDIFVSNSGLATGIYNETKDGWESTLQTNLLGTALMAILLLPHLSSTPTDGPIPRLVIVSSDSHYWASLNSEIISAPAILEKLNEKAHCTPIYMAQRYFVSKLLNLFFVRAFAARLSPHSPVTVPAVSPSWCQTELTRELTFPLSFFFGIVNRLFGRTPEQGSRTIVHGALGMPESGHTFHGQYLVNCVVREEADFVLSSEGRKVQERIWNETIQILSAVDPRVGEIVTEHLNSVPAPHVY